MLLSSIQTPDLHLENQISRC